MLKRLLHKLFLLFLAAFALLLIVFCVANREAVTVSFHPLPFEIDAPLYVLVLLCVAIGYFMSAIGRLSRNVSYHVQKRQLSQQKNALENELAAMKIESLHAVNHRQPQQAISGAAHNSEEDQAPATPPSAQSGKRS